MFSVMDYRSIVALHEERHFTRAARIVGMTQPALTARLRRVEENLGVQLFKRSRSGVEPTPAGIAFTEAARRIVDMADQAVLAAKDAERGLGQFLRVGMTQIAAMQVVIPILKTFRREHPYARIRLIEATTSALENQVEQNLLDVAFLHPPVHEPGLSEHHLMSQPLAKYTVEGEQGPTIRYMRKDAPVLMTEIDRKDPDRAEFDAQVEVDTVIGAIVLSRAGYGPFVAPKGMHEQFGQIGTPFIEQQIDIDLGTSIVWRSLDRRPIVADLLDVCRRS